MVLSRRFLYVLWIEKVKLEKVLNEERWAKMKFVYATKVIDLVQKLHNIGQKDFSEKKSLGLFS